MHHRLAAALVAVLVLAHLTVAVASETGIASWYGPGFAGRKTASGERFNPNAVSCAHKRLRLGSIVKVTDLHTGRSIRCRINDRGPYVRGRVIDLSKGAARALGMRGLARVRVEVVR
jgi:rare lipoprotein A